MSIKYSPEKFGVEVVAEFERRDDLSYEFDTILMVRRIEDRTLWVAYDRGCSCPSPFEDTVFPTDFTQIRTREELRNYVMAKDEEAYTKGDGLQEKIADMANAAGLS